MQIAETAIFAPLINLLRYDPVSDTRNVTQMLQLKSLMLD